MQITFLPRAVNNLNFLSQNKVKCKFLFTKTAFLVSNLDPRLKSLSKQHSEPKARKNTFRNQKALGLHRGLNVFI